ncbi:MAG: enoyl-CoA hydratase/isomerase family protein [candidate division Zixibacteria bacterium]|nr:enoyl-CoA hydratase/isomerase family protein [candidate division Zixibacteria bacterium]MDH3936637.1 enoyl-CoA hydratase/isomerase family protein [candidate division Zixibacteria bacterium]MDH4034182.1 enoyl-CoA hydratase/isomerase family protein [candidate division Zixibacteria bacterium]
MPAFANITFETTNRVAYITLRREELNVLNIAMMEEINSALESLTGGNDLKALVFKADGKAFSAGVDVSEHTAELVDKMINTFHMMFRLLDGMQCPTIAFVQGAALGGGCELACFCDMVIAAAGVKFGQPEIKVGVFPPVAAASFPRSAHLKQVYELLLTGDVIKAEQAQEIGLVNRVLPRENFASDCEAWLARLTVNSAAILRLTKKAVRSGLGKSFKDALSSAEQIYLREMMSTKDAHEGLTAFMEKRSPKWDDG